MSDLSPLIDELDAWNAAGLTATFWWRDDDAVEPTEQLDHLFAVAQSVPIALAVVSGVATPKLAERLKGHRGTTVLQHGWQHTNHGGSPDDPTEYPGSRAAADVLREFQDGRERMSSLFGDLFWPVFAPPYHGFDDKFLPLLAQSGLWSISRRGPRTGAAKTAKIFEGNVHTGVLRWPRLVEHLRGRRLGTYDADEPTGLLTHHLVETSASYDLIKRIVDVIGAHKAAKWLSASEIFPRRAPN
jgi:hypothetical protein